MAREFLPNVGMEELRRLAKTEKVPKAKTRLLACIQRKTGKTYEEIAADLNEPFGTVYGWLKRIEKDGLEARYNKKQKGASCKLDAGQLEQLVDDLEKGPAELGYGTAMWTMPLVRRHIEEKFRTTYHVRSMSNLMHRLGFRRVVPRPRNAKSATPAEREAFKKKVRQMAEEMSKDGYTILVEDESHMVLESTPKKGWFRQKRPVTTTGRAKGAVRRTTIMGVIGDGGAHHFECYDTGNWANTSKFLENVHKKFGKCLVFMDNAGYHRKSMLEKMTEETGGEMRFVFFPTYTPELNPIEKQWEIIKRCLAGLLLKDASEVSDTLQAGITRKTIPIAKMHDYLTV